MIPNRLNKFFILIVCIGFVFVFSSCDNSLKEGTIICTQLAENHESNSLNIQNYLNYFSNAKIVAFNAEKQSGFAQILTEEFFSACAPSISFDGESMVFSGQKNKNDVWQIWEMNLTNLKINGITNSSENCFDPAYLPNGTVVFSKRKTTNVEDNFYALFTCKLDGTDLMQITYNPNQKFGSSILRDGRILTISSQIYPENQAPIFVVLRPDGTKEELFYKSEFNATIVSSGIETSEEKIVFIESDSENKGSIVSINYNRPFHSYENLSSGISGYFNSVYPITHEKFIVTYRTSSKETFALYEFNPVTKLLGNKIYKDEKNNLVQAVVVLKKERPKKLPSEIILKNETGLLVSQNINFLDIKDIANKQSIAIAEKVEIEGMKNYREVIDVEEDGSFYIKVPANTPFRIKTLDKNGNIVKGPSGWIYLRPNERRGCIGCHEDKEQSPENVQPLAVRKEPISIFVQKKENNQIKVDF
ncbi:hypothetical protein [Lutibacter sp.]|uniref:HzsA-related protein n=1 Tax=Lutibacter sp. TaxID=1925666 RepID=UPI0027328987|nr:hypothetical protein [Lutibacter sp.]MDP3314030.1 hypothetical protein [Lutibacter sp.]